MKLSTKGRYGVRTMADLVLYYGQGPILLKDIAKRQEISKKYLEHIITPLKIAGLVKSIRGPHGGYILAKPPAQIKLSQIIKILEGSIALVECIDDPGCCSRVEICSIRGVWGEIKRAMDEVLESISLKDLVERKKKKEQDKNVIYNI